MECTGLNDVQHGSGLFEVPYTVVIQGRWDHDVGKGALENQGDLLLGVPILISVHQGLYRSPRFTDTLNP